MRGALLGRMEPDSSCSVKSSLLSLGTAHAGARARGGEAAAGPLRCPYRKADGAAAAAAAGGHRAAAAAAGAGVQAAAGARGAGAAAGGAGGRQGGRGSGC